jgi:Type IIA topoisomerase (DNA gyrase/topo II, topoisomerase IV), B subunit
MNPETRTLVRVKMEDAEMASKVVIQLMGSEAQGRRDFIEANAHKVDLSVM